MNGLSNWREGHRRMHARYGGHADDQVARFVRASDGTEYCHTCGECNPWTGDIPDTVQAVFGGGHDQHGVHDAGQAAVVDAVVLLYGLVERRREEPTEGDCALLNAARHLLRDHPELCSACGSPRPAGQSCGCFDNGCQ